MFYPKTLVIGQPFNLNSGGGITISSLFKNWPKERLALATIPHKLKKNDIGICKNVYCLGNEELKILFPFNLLLKNQKSGLIQSNICEYEQKNEKGKINFLGSTIYRILFRLIFILDLNFLFYRIHPSNKLLTYIKEDKPDVIYTQLGHLEFIIFINELYKHINIPLVVHIMDDWPKHSAQGIFKKYWQKRLDVGFRQLISKSTVLLSISEAMTEEYSRRYGKTFIPFHNPIENHERKLITEQVNSKNEYSIIYTGRIGFTNKVGIIDLCNVINNMRVNGHKINFRIYSVDSEKVISRKIRSLNGVIIEKPCRHSDVISILQSADLLFLPLDFDDKSIGYAKLSMPTKASEYMVSGTPILLYAPKKMGITISATKHEWAKVVSNRSNQELTNTIINLLEDKINYKTLSDRAYKFSIKNFNAANIRERFRNILTIK